MGRGPLPTLGLVIDPPLVLLNASAVDACVALHEGLCLCKMPSSLRSALSFWPVLDDLAEKEVVALEVMNPCRFWVGFTGNIIENGP